MPKLSKDEIAILTEKTLEQAKYFLSEADEFYPFGTVIDASNKIKPISIYWGEEHPSSSEVLEKLEEAIKQGLQLKEYICAVIAVDVSVNINTIDEIQKKDAIELRLYEAESCVISHYLYYRKNNEYTFELANVNG